MVNMEEEDVMRERGMDTRPMMTKRHEWKLSDESLMKEKNYSCY